MKFEYLQNHKTNREQLTKLKGQLWNLHKRKWYAYFNFFESVESAFLFYKKIKSFIIE